MPSLFCQVPDITHPRLESHIKSLLSSGFDEVFYYRLNSVSSMGLPDRFCCSERNLAQSSPILIFQFLRSDLIFIKNYGRCNSTLAYAI